MPRRLPLFQTLALVALLAGCQFQVPGKGQSPDDVTPNAVAGDAIEVTALDAPPPAADTVPPPEGTGVAQPQTAPPEAPVAVEVAEPAAEPAPQPDLGAEDGSEAEAEVAAEPEPPPAPPKSENQIACEKKKGTWSSTGGKAHVCIFRTKDAGKNCTKGTQCEGDCLARSGTCSPIRPLLGCNEILQDNGARVTLCID